MADIHQDLHYDPETGAFIWLRKFRGKVRDRAGSVDHYGYLNIRWRGKLYKAHRLAWLYVYGEWPATELDHINGDPADNRIANLRLATRIQQNANSKRRKDNTTGYKGVSRTASGAFGAYIRIGGKTKWLGRYNTPEEAHSVYMAAAKELFGVKFARAA